MAKGIYVAILATTTALFTACGPAVKPNPDTLTTGKISISVDENYQYLGEEMVGTFVALNRDAKITASYKSEYDAFNDLLKDSARVIMVNRELNAYEKAYFDSLQITPKTTKIAFDAVAFIVNKNNPDTNLTVGHLRSIFEGKTPTWQQLHSTSTLGNMQVVFDNASSSNARFLQEKFGLKAFPDYCQAASSNPNVLKYVEEHPNTIGVIGVNWISDKDDSTSMSFLKNTKVVYLSAATDLSFEHDFFPPLAGHLALKEYPLYREVYLIKREPYNGLGTGFVNFCYGEKGKRIVRLMGLLPANITARVVRVKDE